MRHLILILLAFLAFNLTAQENQNNFLDKINQHSVSADFASISYSYAHKFGSKLTLGVTAQTGFASRFYLAGTSFTYSQNAIDKNGNTQFGETHEFGDYFVDLAKIHFFYRPSIGEHLYFDLGPYFSFGYIKEKEISNNMITNGGISTGIEVAFYYQFWKMHVGTKLSGGFQYIGNSDGDLKYTALFSTPLVIGFNF